MLDITLKTEEEILAFDVSDEALEIVAATVSDKANFTWGFVLRFRVGARADYGRGRNYFPQDCGRVDFAVAAVLPACTSLNHDSDRLCRNRHNDQYARRPARQKEVRKRAQPTMEIGATLREMAWTQ
jgi:hypothetical protein